MWMAILMFAAAYAVSVTYVSVFYHRGLAHGAIELSPWFRRFVIASGNWVTGIDPKGWTCMHRLHHLHSDTERDPHSPVHVGFFGIPMRQLRSYKRILSGLVRGKVEYTRVVADLDFPVGRMNQSRLWTVPYLLQMGIGVVLGFVLQNWMVGVAFFLGIAAHPIQGWLVNAAGHMYGHRNFDTLDNSKNNHLVAWLVLGEGYQNNHHKYPSSAKFSYRWFEFDIGFVVCRALVASGLAAVRKDGQIPSSRLLAPVTVTE